jgi:hypothetical protein
MRHNGATPAEQEAVMNTKALARNSLIAIAAAAVIGVAHPEAAKAGEQIQVTIPFDFIVGNTRMPAGKYVIEEDAETPIVWLIETSDGSRASFITTIEALSTQGNSTRPDLDFEMFSGEHFLSRIDLHDGTAREIVLTRPIMEEELAKASAHSDR